MNLKYILERKYRLKGKRWGQIINTSINMFENKLRRPKVFSEPMTLQIEPTNRCNLLCKHCFRFDKASKRETGDMTYEDFKKIINQFKYLFDVSLIGLGESFLNRDLPKMIDLLGRRRIDISLTTNGTVLDNQILDAINRAKKVQIQFSLDAAKPSTYEKIRGIDCFDKIVSNIEKFMRLKQPEVLVSMGLVVMKDNLDELGDFILLAKELGIERIHFGDLSGSWLGNNRDELLIQQRDKLERNIAHTFDLAKKNNIDLRYNRYFYVWNNKDFLTKCWFLWQFPYITWDGYLTSCCNLPNPVIHNFGNVLKTPFRRLWNNEGYCNFRKLLKEGKPPKLCISCQHA
jgi:MoaA/NifB/PqqE/SkfB family radical SAM enzyme